MDLKQKLEILGASAKYDSCASVPLSRKGNSPPVGCCTSFLPDGRCISLFKVLLTNKCLGDCKYCMNSSLKKSQKTEFTSKEYVRLFFRFYEENYVNGLFLSSGVQGDSDETMERMLEVTEDIRLKYNFRGYIHLKILPGASYYHLKRASELADRISLNLEAPDDGRFSELISTKDFKIDILRRMAWAKGLEIPAGQTTQFVVGAFNETDFEILKMLSFLYQKMKLKRGYFSAFKPIEGTPLERHRETPLLREHRLYQADFLLRKYDFEFKDLVFRENENLYLNFDPKFVYALEHQDLFPVDVNDVEFSDLLKVPGIGPKSAQRIVKVREDGFRFTKLKELSNLGVVLKRARGFIQVEGSYQRRLDF
ncbi:MAG: putative DNA modification/repair radical SAM protein [Candidatus Methanofastidiosia archaeon]